MSKLIANIRALHLRVGLGIVGGFFDGVRGFGDFVVPVIPTKFVRFALSRDPRSINPHVPGTEPLPVRVRPRRSLQSQRKVLKKPEKRQNHENENNVRGTLEPFRHVPANRGVKRQCERKDGKVEGRVVVV